MTLNQLRYLVAIADTGLNITLAAERVHATQPGVSRQIKQLEGELGLVLFTRKGRSLASLTPAGEAVLVHARRLLGEAANIRVLAANQRGERQGHLTLVTTHTQARYVLPGAIAATRREFPGVSIRLHPSAEAEILGWLARGGADMIVISTSGGLPDAGIAVPLFRWRRVVLVPSGHALAHRPAPPTLRELSVRPLVSYESSRRPESSLRRAFEAVGLSMQLAMTAHDADLIKTYVRSGIGVGILAEMAIDPGDTDLRVLAAPETLPECTTWAVLPRGRVLRDFALRLLSEIAPQIDAISVRRVMAGNAEPDWPTPPYWQALKRTAPA
jgi:DNA-binding transcriptional LysR family regulator